MKLEFKGFHPKDSNNEVILVLTDEGIEYINSYTHSFQFIPYTNIAGFSGWFPNYASLHIYSNNVNLKIHVNFPQEFAESYLNEIKNVIKEKINKLYSQHSTFQLSQVQ